MSEKHTTDRTYRALILAFLVMLATALVAVVLGVTYSTMRAGDQAEVNGQMIEDIHEVNDRLLDCTEPGGVCFEAEQDRVGQAVFGLTSDTFRVIVSALSCQNDGIVKEKALARCTASRLSTVQAPPG